MKRVGRSWKTKAFVRTLLRNVGKIKKGKKEENECVKKIQKGSIGEGTGTEQCMKRIRVLKEKT